MFTLDFDNGIGTECMDYGRVLMDCVSLEEKMHLLLHTLTRTSLYKKYYKLALLRVHSDHNN